MIAYSIPMIVSITNVLVRLKPATGYFEREVFSSIDFFVDTFRNATATIAVA